MSDDTSPKTLSVPKAGELYFGLSRNGSYNAARSGVLPTVRVGKLLRVPVHLLEKMIDRPSVPRRRKREATSAAAAS